MCGIAGFTQKNYRLEPSCIRNAVRALLHRGPDQQGIYESPDVSLGAVRLRIIDLIGGDQPISSADGDTVLVFNGEIYNHRELRDQLRAKGYRFSSSSDTEVVLHAFREWDTQCFSRLRGMFAIAIWTPSQKRLVLARDRVGIKPLYFYRAGTDLFFGSEIKAILEHPGVERQIAAIFGQARSPLGIGRGADHQRSAHQLGDLHAHQPDAGAGALHQHGFAAL